MVAQSIGDSPHLRPEAVGLGYPAYELIPEGQITRSLDFGMKDSCSESGGFNKEISGITLELFIQITEVSKSTDSTKSKQCF